MKAVMFDLWNTLAYRKGVSAKDILTALGLEVKYESFKILDKTIGLQSFKTTKEAALKVCEYTGKPERTERVERVLKGLEKERLCFYPDVKQVLKKLKNKYKLGLISNTSMFSVKTFPLEMKKLFDVIGFSYKLGMMKPEPGMFLYVLEKLKARPEECVMVGDSVNDDMLPARKLGMKTVLIKRNIRIYFEPKKYEPVITDLNQLEQYLYS